MTNAVRAVFWLPVWMGLLDAADFNPPPTKAVPVTETLHGIQITDPYRWLENQTSPETRAWLAEQDKFARRYLDSVPSRAQIRKGIEGLLKIDNMSAPKLRNGRYFFSRRRANEDRTSLWMRRGYQDNDELLVDPNAISSEPTTSVEYRDVASDGTIVAFGIRHGGEDEEEIRLMDVATRKLLPDVLPRGRYSNIRIEPGKRGFYYARYGAGQGPRLFRHSLGSPASEDRELFGNGYGPNFDMDFLLSDNGRWLVLVAQEGVPATQAELFVQDLGAGGPIQNIWKGRADLEPDLAGDALLVSTNWNAPNWKIFRVDLKNPASAQWKEIVPETAQAITGFSAAGGRIFVRYLENVATRIKQFDIDGKYLGDLKPPGVGTTSAPGGQWESDQAFFTFVSYVEPQSVWRVTVSTGRQDTWFRATVPVDASKIETKQVWYTSKDGTRVPMFVVHRKDVPLDGRRPTLLSGYGGFNIPSLPSFSVTAAWWAEHGGVFAVANLRGGGEFGENWHKAGMFEKKQNVFDDFIAAAEWLVQNKYTQPANLGIIGGSNGGLLMGAMMTQRPDLFGAIVCSAPLLDMLRFHKLSVGSWWVSEYGSADDPMQFAYLYKYSPYHNVRKTAYPAILFSTGDADTRVDPSHARKMTALVQASNTADTPVILRYDTQGGHSATGSVDKTADLSVDLLGFLCDRLGLKIP